jgi:hypothetical protein
LEGQTSPALVALIRVGLRGVTSLACEEINIMVIAEIVRVPEPDVAGVGPRSLGRVAREEG